jgi:GNAT superfamily N-acetyltransferase
LEEERSGSVESMMIEMAGVSSELMAEYAAIPIAFDVTSVLSAKASSGRSFLLTESAVVHPYVKDYDAVSERPRKWATRFDTSPWALFLARIEGRGIGGATVAFRTSGLDMLEGRTDLAVLWDIRVAPPFRGRGVGRGLFAAAEAWAIAQGCRDLKVETQNVNVAACRFYAALGCQLRIVREEAYPPFPGEAQFLWYKTLPRSTVAAC